MSQRLTILFGLLLIACFSGLSAQVYPGAGGPIHDDGRISDFPIEVSGLADGMTPAYGLQSVCVTLTHSWMADLDIRLVAPDGFVHMLLAVQGGDGDDCQNTCFTMTAPGHVIDAFPPFTGMYRPYSNLGNVNNGQSGNGTWVLRILDTYAFADAGAVSEWRLEFGPDAASPDPAVLTPLPIVSIQTDGQTIPNEPKIDGTIRVYDNGALNALTDAPAYEGFLGIEVRGSSSQSFPKKSFGFETRDAEGEDDEVALLGLPKEEDWILYAPFTDKSLLRDALTYKLANDLGRYAPRTVFCELYLNGDYHGIYALEEKIKRDKNRVNITKLNPQDTVGDALTGGYLLKVDRDDGEGTYFVSNYEGSYPNEEVRIVYEDPEGPDLDPRQKDYIAGFCGAFEDALYGDNFTDPLLGYRRYIDVGSFIDFFILSELGHNVDAYRLSSFLYKDRDSSDSLLHAGPMWDFNLAYGNVDFCASQWTLGWAYEDSGACGNTPGWWARLLEDPAYRDALRCRYDELREDRLSTDALFHYLDSTAAVLEQADARNYSRWPILGRYVWPNFYIGSTYAEEVEYLKTWIAGRLAWLDDNMPGECAPVTAVEPVPAAGQLHVAPNPANDAVFLSMPGMPDTPVRVNVFDGVGKHCMTRTMSMPGTLDVSGLGNGHYMIRIADASGQAAAGRLIIAR